MMTGLWQPRIAECSWCNGKGTKYILWLSKAGAAWLIHDITWWIYVNLCDLCTIYVPFFSHSGRLLKESTLIDITAVVSFCLVCPSNTHCQGSWEPGLGQTDLDQIGSAMISMFNVHDFLIRLFAILCILIAYNCCRWSETSEGTDHIKSWLPNRGIPTQKCVYIYIVYIVFYIYICYIQYLSNLYMHNVCNCDTGIVISCARLQVGVPPSALWYQGERVWPGNTLICIN